MQAVSIRGNLHEIPNAIFREKKEENITKCHILKILLSMLRINKFQMKLLFIGVSVSGAMYCYDQPQVNKMNLGTHEQAIPSCFWMHMSQYAFCGPVYDFLAFCLQIAIEPLLWFPTVVMIICFSLCFTDEIEDPYADQTYVCYLEVAR